MIPFTVSTGKCVNLIPSDEENFSTLFNKTEISNEDLIGPFNFYLSDKFKNIINHLNHDYLQVICELKNMTTNLMSNGLSLKNQTNDKIVSLKQLQNLHTFKKSLIEIIPSLVNSNDNSFDNNEFQLIFRVQHQTKEAFCVELKSVNFKFIQTPTIQERIISLNNEIKNIEKKFSEYKLIHELKEKEEKQAANEKIEYDILINLDCTNMLIREISSEYPKMLSSESIMIDHFKEFLKSINSTEINEKEQEEEGDEEDSYIELISKRDLIMYEYNSDKNVDEVLHPKFVFEIISIKPEFKDYSLVIILKYFKYFNL